MSLIRRRVAIMLAAVTLVGATIVLESCRPDDGGWRMVQEGVADGQESRR